MFLDVLTQVLILLILIMLGFVLTKAKVLNGTAVTGMTDLVLLTVTPCVIIKSFIREFDPSLIKNLLISFLIAFILHIVYIVLSLLLLRDKDKAREKVLRFGAIFSNCGFMAIPLLDTLIGDIGVFYGSSYLTIFNVLVWSYGLMLMSGDKSVFTAKKLILNPGIIGMAVGLLVFFLKIPVPQIIKEPISFMAALNTPVPMIIIGFHLANSNLLDGLRNLKAVFSMALKLIIFPLISLFGLYFCGIRGEVLLACIICASAPTAAITTMFSSKYDGDTPLSVSMVSLSTILSIISIPIILTLAEYLM